MLLLQVVCSRKVCYICIVAEIEELAGVLLVPLQVQSCVEGPRVALCLELEPDGWHLLFYKGEVVLADGLVLVRALVIAYRCPQRKVENIKKTRRELFWRFSD